MAVYVDDARLPFNGGWRMSHMQSDTLGELHSMAIEIGLNPSWFQPGSRPEAAHYDVTDSKRAAAIRLGAVEETVKEGSERRRAARAARVSS